MGQYQPTEMCLQAGKVYSVCYLDYILLLPMHQLDSTENLSAPTKGLRWEKFCLKKLEECITKERLLDKSRDAKFPT